ncbi:STAS domain-containing protein, partial [Candidatus Gracilibacteria bacterium]|nr:STAS domain-containing protein [Candidatus Gracilibacteria bacterium]
RHLLDSRETLLNILDELATPVLPLLPGIVMSPIVGSVDTRRMLQMTTTLLHSVDQEKARVALIDITGVPVVDTHVASALIDLARSARLMGCRSVIVGIRPETAQAMIGLGIDLSEFITHATLADGLRTALTIVGYRLERHPKEQRNGGYSEASARALTILPNV